MCESIEVRGRNSGIRGEMAMRLHDELKSIRASLEIVERCGYRSEWGRVLHHLSLIEESASVAYDVMCKYLDERTT